MKTITYYKVESATNGSKMKLLANFTKKRDAKMYAVSKDATVTEVKIEAFSWLGWTGRGA